MKQLAAAKPRKKPKAKSQEIAAWGKVNAELRAFAKLYDTRAIEALELDDFDPFGHGEPFFPSAAEWKAYEKQTQSFGWPVWLLAKFAGLHPIGATNGGDFWLARVADDDRGRARVYLYDHETGELAYAHASIADLIAGKPRGKASKLPHDPVTLWERAEWIAGVLGADALDEPQRTVAKAPAFAHAAKAPATPEHVAYWLAHHALMDNREAFAALVKKLPKQPFVAVLAKRMQAFLAGTHAFGKQSAAEIERVLGELRELEPRMREPAAVAASKAAAKRAPRDESEHTDDVKVHLARLKALARTDRSLAPRLAAFTTLVTRPPEGGAAKFALFDKLEGDERFAAGFAAAIRNGLKITKPFGDPTAVLVDKLAAWRDPHLRETITTGFLAIGDLIRLSNYLVAVRAWKDPRIDERLARLRGSVADPAVEVFDHLLAAYAIDELLLTLEARGDRKVAQLAKQCRKLDRGGDETKRLAKA